MPLSKRTVKVVKGWVLLFKDEMKDCWVFVEVANNRTEIMKLARNRLFPRNYYKTFPITISFTPTSSRKK